MGEGDHPEPQAEDGGGAPDRPQLPSHNPFAPGAGTPPPELAGRGTLIESVHIALERARIGRPAKSAMLVGLRGVGKTVLLDRMRDDAEAAGIHTVRLEAPEGRSLPALLAPQLRQALLALLTPLAAQQVTAREAYSSMTRLVARLEGDVPTGARLVGLLQLFNAQRPAGLPAIPIGTAGVAQDCVAAYRRSLVRANTLGVAHPALPADMVEGLNRWLERLLELMKDEIRRPYEAEAVQLRAQLAAAPGQGVIEFHPDGGSSGGRIRLQREGAEWRIDVGWLTGEVRSGPWQAP